MTTGQRIKFRRKTLGISADALAVKLGVSRSTVFRYENGDIEKMPADILKPLSEALQTSPAYLLGWTDDPESWLVEKEPSGEELFAVVKKLSVEDQKKVLEYALLHAAAKKAQK